MARLSRYFVKNQPQHMIQRGNNRELIFAGNADYRFYLECLQEAPERHRLAIHATVADDPPRASACHAACIDKSAKHPSVGGAALCAALQLYV